MSNDKITLKAPGSDATITTHDEKQAANLVTSGWTRLADGAPVPKAAAKPKTSRARAKKPVAAPVEADEAEDDGSAPGADADSDN